MKFETNPLSVQEDMAEVLNALEYHEPIEISISETKHVETSDEIIEITTEQNNIIRIILNGYTIDSNKAGVESWETVYVPVDDGGIVVEVINCESHPTNTSKIIKRQKYPYDGDTEAITDINGFESYLPIALSEKETDEIVEGFYVDQITMEELIEKKADIELYKSFDEYSPRVGMVWNPFSVYEEIERSIPESIIDVQRWVKASSKLSANEIDESLILDWIVDSYQQSDMRFGFQLSPIDDCMRN